MNPPSQILRQLLVVAGVLDPAKTFLVHVPDVPDDAVGIFDTAGTKDGRLMSNGQTIIHHGVQILLRGRNYPALWDLAVQVAGVCDSVARMMVVVDSRNYLVHNISRTGDILNLGLDSQGERRRYLLSINAVMTVTEE
jgi:hypothetical protein